MTAEEIGAEVTFVVSATTGEGILQAKNGIAALFLSEKLDYHNTAIVRNARQYHSLCQVEKSLSRAAEVLGARFSQDIAALDLEQALSHLLELDGRQVAEEVVHEIFSRFCVGK